MKLSILSVGAIAVCALAAPAPEAPISTRATNQQCASRNTLQLYNYLSTVLTYEPAAKCREESGLGYVAGIGGFNTKSGLTFSVVKHYTESPHYKGEFKDVYSALAKAAKEHSESTDGLSGFCPAWKKAVKNGPAFYQAQIRTLYDGSEDLAHKLAKGIQSKFALTDTAVMLMTAMYIPGTSKAAFNPIGLHAMKKITGNITGNSGNSITIGKYKVDEGKWLHMLLDMADKMVGDADRRAIKILRNLAAAGSYKLDGTIKFQGFGGKSVTLNCK
ncbi:hypothetical protein H4R19_000865 [Coemansia spiralis]|nr:hypothetical protein H4R19_000865 [Coemansia spiralis]